MCTHAAKDEALTEEGMNSADDEGENSCSDKVVIHRVSRIRLSVIAGKSTLGRLTFDMRGTGRLAGQCPLDGRVSRLFACGRQRHPNAQASER
jgi:hypothetical protein